MSVERLSNNTSTSLILIDVLAYTSELEYCEVIIIGNLAEMSVFDSYL